MSEFDRPLSGYRLADTLRSDTLQMVAMRELGNAARWVDLANINGLLPPYLTDDPLLASSRVLLTGSKLLVPALEPVSQNAAGTTPDDLYQTDIGLFDGDLEVSAGGDFLILDGRANLRQALKNRVLVERGELIFHPEFGCLVRRLIGVVNGPTASVMAAKYVASTLRADPRVSKVVSTTAEVIGDTINVVADVIPISGQSTKIEVTI
jgi:phage baseplate assembly protein W